MRKEYDFSGLNAQKNSYTRSGRLTELEGEDKARKAALDAFNELRQQAAKNGYMTDEEIEAEIQKARNES